AAVARLAASRGFDVAVNYRVDERAALNVVEDVRRIGARGIAVQGDVSDERAILKMYEAVDQFGQLGGLVNNAGISGGFARLADLDSKVLGQVLGVNVYG